MKPPNGLSHHPRVPLDGLSHHPRIFRAAVQAPDRDHTARMSVNERIKPKIDVNLLSGNEDEAELDGDRCEKQLADTSGCGRKVRLAPHQPFDPFKPPFFIVLDQNRSAPQLWDVGSPGGLVDARFIGCQPLNIQTAVPCTLLVEVGVELLCLCVLVTSRAVQYTLEALTPKRFGSEDRGISIFRALYWIPLWGRGYRLVELLRSDGNVSAGNSVCR